MLNHATIESRKETRTLQQNGGKSWGLVMNRHKAQRQKRTLLNLHPIASHIVVTSRHNLTPLARKRIARSGTVVASLIAAVGLTTAFAAAQQSPESSQSNGQSRAHTDIHALVQSSTEQAQNTPSASPDTMGQASSNTSSRSSSVVINGQQVQSGNGTVQKTITDDNGNTTNVTVTIDSTPDTTNTSSSDSSVNVDTYSGSYSSSFNFDNSTRGP